MKHSGVISDVLLWSQSESGELAHEYASFRMCLQRCQRCCPEQLQALMPTVVIHHGSVAINRTISFNQEQRKEHLWCQQSNVFSFIQQTYIWK